jgi:outer membrane protein assembly factor BamD
MVRFGRSIVAGALATALIGAAACGRRAPLPPDGAVDADQFLIERGREALKEERWFEAREYFRRLVDTYPNSPHRYEAKLGVGDTFLGENRADSLVLAVNEFREFLTFFPLHERAPYAQYRLALAQKQQMLGPRRDQTATRAALEELDRFLANYPNSPLRPEVEKERRFVRDRLSESEFLVGRFHYQNRMYAGALGRLQPLLKDDPQFSRTDSVLFYIAETYFKIGRPAEALPYYERVVKEHPDSEHVEDATKRIAEIKVTL